MNFRLSFTVLLYFSTLPGIAETITISKEKLLDKIKGGWAGQTIGCTYGGPTEFRYRGKIIEDSIQIIWSDNSVQHYFDKQPGLFDDLYMDLTFVDVMHKEGIDAPVESHANAFAKAGYSLWHANQAARYNINHGINPPLSGHWKNNPHADDIDYQIEADFAGIISPAMPNAASAISDKIGHIMNYGDGWYGGVYVGAMYSLAYIYNDVETIVNEGLKVIPPKSKFYQCMKNVILWHKQYPSDWKRTWQLVQENYSDEIGCPDGVKSPFDIDALINSAYILIGLLYGEGDFSRTLDISTRCGQDSDCNPASAGGILGCMLGYSNIPDYWLKSLKPIEDINFDYTDISLNRAYEYSYQLALEMIKRKGGKESEDAVCIKVQQPRKVKFEQSFPGMKVVETRKGRMLKDFGTEKFCGTGIVVLAYWKGNDNRYIAEVDAFIDGKYQETIKFPTEFHDRTTELFWIYDLKDGPHELTFKQKNPNDKIEINCHKMIIYGKDSKK